MGNCLGCFKDKDRGRRAIPSGYEYEPERTKAQQEVTITNANYNNNYPTAQYPPQPQARQTRDVLEQSEIQGLLGPTSHPDETKSSAPPSHDTSTGSSFGLKLLKKPMNILNGNNSSTGCGTTAAAEPAAQTGQISDNKINALFEAYRDDECEDAILAPGIERLCCDLRYKPEDFAVLVLAWRLDASQMCRFTKAEFIQGLHTLNADSIESTRQRLEEEVVQLGRDAEMFKKLYRFTFKFGLEPDLRTLPLDMAISLWRLVFTVHTPEILGKWLDYLAEHPHIRGVPKDTWNMFLNFAETCDIYSYSDEDAWPSVFDDFVEYENERRKEQQQQQRQEVS